MGRLCEDCGLEHPEGQTANPHYCIARLGERLECCEARAMELEGQLDRLTDINIDIDSDRSKTRADNAALRKELAEAREALGAGKEEGSK